tara:strand:+ start:71 stop:1636 length:1566 start_codon:yes stop_codon:yes gene_type:complete
MTNGKKISKSSILKQLIDNKIFVFEDITLKNGGVSPYYCNFKNLYNDHNLVNNILSYISNMIEFHKLEADKISGVPLGALPLATLLSNKLGKGLLMTREEKKQYGMKSLIEGVYQLEDKVLLLEDVVTTGKSVIDEVKLLRNNGLTVTHVISLFNRNEGGKINLDNNNINLLSIFQFNDLITLLESNDFDKHILEKLRFYHDKTQKKLVQDIDNSNEDNVNLNEKSDNNDDDDDDNEENKHNNNLYDPDYTYNKLLDNHHELLSIMEQKKTALCLSLDTMSWKYGYKILDDCGPYICMVKLHVELFLDWNDNCMNQLLELSEKHNFKIMQDSKLPDVPSINDKIVTNLKYKINQWANYITIQPYNYVNNMRELSKYNIKYTPVCEMNIENNFYNEEYIENVSNMLKIENKNKLYDIPCIVSQKLFRNNKNVLRFTPGVVCDNDDMRFVDNSRYRTIETAMIKDKNHIVIIGSNILDEEDYVDKCKKCSKSSWGNFEMMYKKILIELNKYNNNKDKDKDKDK